jgi:hypothetical protein
VQVREEIMDVSGASFLVSGRDLGPKSDERPRQFD